ncbi:MAG: SRPBCC domain-containing protein [Saprospiraceae bacterium]|nr:SRPBCC domain-containing protein [Saprospiraceae bacterium]
MAINVSIVQIKASKEKVWQAITDPDHVKSWQYNSELITTWKVNESINFSTPFGDSIYKQWGTVIAFQPYDMVKYSLFAPRPGMEDLPENYFIMTYVLTAIDEGTELEIIQEDNRPNAIQEDKQGEENPVLMALKVLSENL